MENAKTKQRQSDFYFFGCKSGIEKGHYLYLPNKRSAESRYLNDFWADLPQNWQRKIDGTLCPQGQQIEGKALVHHLDGWTALAFWDRSADHRPGSNVVFLAYGTFGFEEMLQIVCEQFPEIKARFTYSIFEAEQ